jgi:hypothetical protein
LENDLQFSKTGNVVSIVKRGENDPTVDGAMDYWNQESTRTKVDFIKTNILDADGEFVSTEAQEAANLGMLADEVALAKQEIAEAKAAEKEEGEKPEAGDAGLVDPNYDPESEDSEAAQAEAAASAGLQPTEADIIKQTREKYPTPNELATAIVADAESAEKLFEILMRTYPEIGNVELSRIANEIFAARPEPEEEPSTAYIPPEPEGPSKSESRRSARTGG